MYCSLSFLLKCGVFYSIIYRLGERRWRWISRFIEPPPSAKYLKEGLMYGPPGSRG